MVFIFMEGAPMLYFHLSNCYPRLNKIKKCCHLKNIFVRSSELKRQCRLAELRHIFAKYMISPETVDKCMNSHSKFTKLLTHLLSENHLGTNGDRLKDALKALELNPEPEPKRSVEKVDVLLIFAYNLAAKYEVSAESLFGGVLIWLHFVLWKICECEWGGSIG